MVLHIFTANNRVFNVPFMKFIEEKFNDVENVFWVWGEKQENYPISNAIFIRELKFKNIINTFNKADRIILHSLFIPQIVLLLLLNIKWVKKTFWVVWGADLHFHELRKTSVKYYIYDMIRSFFIYYLGGVCTLVPGDYHLLKKWYITNAKYYNAIYLLDQNDILYAYNLKPRNYCKKVRILIGNSATRSNRHFEAFDYIKASGMNNYEIICPLSYGDDNYKIEVINRGRELFGDSFIPIIKYISNKQYIKFLNTIDIAVFNNERQQALGNIYYLMILKKIIVLKKDTVMWKQLVDEEKFFAFDINNLTGKEQMTAGLEKKLEKNREMSIEKNSIENAYNIWKKIIYE